MMTEEQQHALFDLIASTSSSMQDVCEFVDTLIAAETERCAQLFDKFTYGQYEHPSIAIRRKE